MAGGAALGAIQQLLRDLHAMDRDFRNLSGYRRLPAPIGSPVGFDRYHDPAARFEFAYPAGWRLRRDGGVQVSSPKLGSFARVDAVPAAADFWACLEAAVLRRGGEFRRDEAREGPPGRARGGMRLAGLRFEWDGTAHRAADACVVLTLGSVVDPPRSGALELYEQKVLAAIRRSFRLGPGLRRS